MPPVTITIYLWAGKKWFLRIHGECAECDPTIQQAQSLRAHIRTGPPKWKSSPGSPTSGKLRAT